MCIDLLQITEMTRSGYYELCHWCGEILVYIDAQVDAHEKEQRLIEIYNKLDARSYAVYMGEKFKVSLAYGNQELFIK